MATRTGRGMCTDDFCRNNIANPIEITGELVGITEDLLSKLGDNHRKKIEPYVSEDEKLVIRRVQASPGGNKKDRPLYVLKPGEDIEKKDSWDQNPTGIDAAISNLFPSPIHIEAMQDAAQDAAKNTSTSTLGKLLKEVLGNVEAKHSDKLNDAVEDLKQLFSAEGSNRAPELDELDKTTNSALNDLFPGIEVRAEIPVPTLQALFKSGTIRVKDPLRGDDFHGFESVGHGAQRTIQMALIRSMSEMTKSNDDPACRLLLIDEPELYLHPQAIEQVRSALEKLSRNGYQVVFTTHSPTLISRKDVPNTLLIRKTSSGTSVLPTMSSAAKKAIEDNTSQSKTLFTLSNSNQILFCEKVILVEGSTEARLLPYLYETVHGRTLALDKIALVPLGGSGNTHKAIKILQGIGIPYQAVVDLDALIRYGCQYGICDEHNADYCACLSKFDDCQKNGLFILDDNGFPKKLTENLHRNALLSVLQCLISSHILMHYTLRQKMKMIYGHGRLAILNVY